MSVIVHHMETGKTRLFESGYLNTTGEPVDPRKVTGNQGFIHIHQTPILLKDPIYAFIRPSGNNKEIDLRAGDITGPISLNDGKNRLIIMATDYPEIIRR